MTLRYLLDTNVISEPLRPAPDQAVVDHLREHQTEIAIASVVWHELWYGCYRLPASTKRSVIEAYLNNVVARAIPILPYDQHAAQWHAGSGRGWCRSVVRRRLPMARLLPSRLPMACTW